MSADRHPAAEVLLHQEQLRVATRRVPIEKVVVRRRVVSEVRQVEVTVRREELEVSRLPLDGTEQAPLGPPPEPLVILLSEEVPVVQLETRPYERVTVRVDAVAEQVVLTETVAQEHAQVVTEPVAPLGRSTT